MTLTHALTISRLETLDVKRHLLLILLRRVHLFSLNSQAMRIELHLVTHGGWTHRVNLHLEANHLQAQVLLVRQLGVYLEVIDKLKNI